MQYIFDILLFLIFILVIVISTKKGFVRSVWGTVTIIGSFVLAYAFGDVLGAYLCNRFILPIATDYAFNMIIGLLTATEGNYNISELFSSLPTEFILLAEKCGADIDQLRDQFEAAVTISEDRVYDLANSIAQPISETISIAAGIIIIFVSSVLILSIIGLLVRIISKLPVVKTVDAIMGFVFGLIKGIVIVSMICLLTAIIVEFEFMNHEVAMFFKELTTGSYCFKFFCSLLPVKFINVG